MYFFHYRANKRRKRNLFESLANVNGLVEVTIQMEVLFTKFDANLFQTDGVSKWFQLRLQRL